MKKKSIFTILLIFAAAAYAFASGGEAGGGMTHKMMILAIQVGIILFAAKIGSMIFEKIKMPGVLGELAAGMLIGPYLLGGLPFIGFPHGLFPPAAGFPVTPELYGLCTVASIVLLFMVGMETDLRLLLKYSVTGMVVGIGGVGVAFIVGNLSAIFLSRLISDTQLTFFSPEALFLGVISTATSVGITARILSEKKKMDSPEGVTILAGAVIDDVLGIIVLAIVLGIISASKTTGQVEWSKIGIIAAKAIGIWLLFTVLGLVFAKKIGTFLKIFKKRSSIAIMGLGMAMILAGLFEEAGLAMIIGAYIMGLSISRTDLTHVIQEKLHTVQDFLVPIFFCVMGMMVNFRELASWPVIIFGLIYSLLAIVSKIAGCTIPSLFFNFNFRGALRIGVGMVPRGEVALIIAGIGLAGGFLPPQIFGIAIIMTLITTMAAPPALVGLLNSKSGLRKEKGTDEETLITFDLPSPQITEMILAKLLELFEKEEYYVHTLDHEENIYQIRKDEVIIGFRKSDCQIVFDCMKEDVSLINTAFYVVMGDFNEMIKGLLVPFDKQKMAQSIPLAESTKSKNTFDLSSYLKPTYIKTELVGSNKEEIIEELVEHLCACHSIEGAEKEEIRQAVWEREESMSSGMQHGIAIPHGRTDAINELICAIGIKRDGIEFGSLDGKPASIFIITLSPKTAPAPHVQFMSAISQALNSENRRRILVTAATEELFKIFTGKAPDVKRGPEEEDRAIINFNLKNYVHPNLVTMELNSDDKREIIEELLQMLVKEGKIRDVETTREAILKRESEMSTGLEKGIAIPHARLDELEDLVCAVGVKAAGVDFDSIDGQPAHIIILTLSPKSRPVPHVQFMSLIIRKLLSREMKDIISIESKESLANFLTATQ